MVRSPPPPPGPSSQQPPARAGAGGPSSLPPSPCWGSRAGVGRAVNGKQPVCAGARPHEDRQEGVAGDHREVLPATDAGLPHQQARGRGNCHHTVQAVEEQDRWVHDGGPLGQ